MPELPDVGVFKRYLDATSLHKTIERVDLRDERMLGRTTGREFRRALTGDRFEGSRRHGKYLFAMLGRQGALVLHFGMTGFLRYFKDEEDDPGHNVIRIAFDNGYSLFYNSHRRLGVVEITDDPAGFIESKGLAPDALRMDAAQFDDRLKARRGHIKSVLMNQHAVAGLGNVYADEVLFQAGIHPRRKVRDLSTAERHRLRRALVTVLHKAIEAGADPQRLPATFLTPRRHAGAVCPRCGTALGVLKVGGRTAYYCPRRQPAP